MKPARLIAALLLPSLLFAVPGGAAQRPAAVPSTKATVIPGEVIVRFKVDASVLRAHALAARARPDAVADVLTRRAVALGARVGRTLSAGAVVGDRMQVVRARGVDAQTLAAELARDPDVEFAEPNRRAHALMAPNDPLYPAVTTTPTSSARPNGVGTQNGPDSGQWYLRPPTSVEVSGIDIESAWNVTSGSANVVVAVLDTGIRRGHPDFAGSLVLQGYDFISDSAIANDGDGRDNDPTDPGDWVSAADVAAGQPLAAQGCTSGDIQDSSWHGTSTASLVGAARNDGVGMAGSAPGATILPVRVLGKCGGTAADIQAAMRWAAGIHVDGVPDNPRPAKVLNLSLGDTSTSCSSGYQSAVNDVLAQGAVIVVAGGNGAGQAVGEPANCTGVIAVVGLRHAGTKVGYSDLGPAISISAPGGNCVNIGSGEPCLYPILAATNTGLQGPLSDTWSDGFNSTIGTSFAAPLVAGTAALMFSAQPELTPAQLRSLVRSTARPFPTSGADNGPGDPTPVLPCHAPNGIDQYQCYCTTALCGAGMLDAGRAVAAAAAASVLPPAVTLTASSSTPTAGDSVVLTASATASGSRTIATYQWQITAGASIAAFSGPTNAASATLATAAAGDVTVQVTVLDSSGASTAQSLTLSVRAAPPAPGGGGGGGGAVSASWLAALALAVAALSAVARGPKNRPAARPETAR